jgi:3-dehydroquinate synthase
MSLWMEALPMSEHLIIKSVFREYSVSFTGDYLASLRKDYSKGDFFIVDRTISELYPEILGLADDKIWRVDSSEESKSYEGVIPVFQKLIEGGFRKNQSIIAIGGGITQDVAAFVASLLYRGVDWIFVPTNVLTQCDSCIGSKTSINFQQYKNQLGGFYPPAAVLIDTQFVKTLGEREIASGLGEMLHYFLVTSEEDLELFWEYAPALRAGGGGLEVLMRRSLEIKKAMIEIDEFDKGPRNIFNYGHSFAHALESATDYAIPHGTAVAYGIDLANLVSEHLGLLPMVERNRIRSACELVFEGAPLPMIDLERYCRALSKDKKNVGNQLGLILTRGIGHMFKQLCDFDDGIKCVIDSYFKDKLYLKDLKP